jgi:hypothetical protein
VNLNYYNAFIKVAADCPVAGSVVPTERGERKTVAVIQYELLADSPYRYTQEEVLFETFVRHKGIPASELAAHGPELRQAFFAKSQACLRASPLPKRYGWGLHFNEEGRVALWPLESEEYRRFTVEPGDGLTLLNAMRSSRT